MAGPVKARLGWLNAGRADAGFSSVEVMVSLVVVSAVVLGSGAAMVTSARIARASQQEVRYWTAIEYQAETLVASETLQAASSSNKAPKVGDTPYNKYDELCQGFDPGNRTLTVQLTNPQLKECEKAYKNGWLSGGGDWQLDDPAAGRVLIITDKPNPKDGATKDTVVVYLHDSST